MAAIHAQQRFMVSPDGHQADWLNPSSCPGWIDCTDMSPEKLQRFIAEKQGVRPHIVGVVAPGRPRSTD